MKVGQEVSFIDGKNGRHTATVIGIPGAGDSGYKTLDLEYKNGGEEVKVSGVPYEGDAEEGQNYWLFKGARRLRGVEDEPVVTEPVDTVAFPDIPETAPPQEDGLPVRKRR